MVELKALEELRTRKEVEEYFKQRNCQINMEEASSYSPSSKFPIIKL